MSAMRCVLLCATVVTSIVYARTAAAQSATFVRPFTVQAMYRLEQIGDQLFSSVVLSPSGKEVAFVVKRPLDTARNMAQGDFLSDNDLADVYLGNLQTSRVEKITNGDADSSGFWDPQWSPDGKRIAMLSTRGGNIYLWVWDRDRGLRRVTNRAVDIVLTPFGWLSNDRILCQVLPTGQQPLLMEVDTQTPRIAMREWPIDWRGRTATANVLESGVPADVAQRPQGELQILDLSGGSVRMQVIAHAAHFDSLTLSRDRRYAAVFAEVGILEPRAGRKLQSNFDDGIYALSVYDMRDGARVAHFDRRDVGSSPLNWSLDGKELAVFGEPATTAYKSHLLIFRCRLATDSCANALPPSLNVDNGPNGSKVAPLWAADGRLVIYAENVAAAKAPGGKGRWDWYGVDRDGNTTNLTGLLSAAPASLVAVEGGRRFVGLVAGKLVNVFPDGRPARSVDVHAPALVNIVWPVTSMLWWGFPKNGVRDLVVNAGKIAQDFLVVDLASNRVIPLARLSPDAALSGFDPQTLGAVFLESGRNGSFVRYAYHGGPLKTFYATNTWLARFAEGRMVSFSYTSLDKEKLNGWIMLPNDYRPGYRYPAVVWVYAGSVMNPKKKPSLTSLSEVHALNLQLLAAHGYAVIFPSMPLPPFGHPVDPYGKLTDGVLPAVDRVVQLGYVDGNRVGVMGQSYGGFSTYGLITQTDRFKAAIALAGISDWTSLYGEYDGRRRYSDYINEDNEFNLSLMEDGQGNFGNPPWVDPERYIRNSPITYVAHVHTPLLIIQGDLDYVAIQQGEEFFTALYRQGKRAEFVRYWGEEHVFRSEANIADYWQRIYAWLDRYVKGVDSK